MFIKSIIEWHNLFCVRKVIRYNRLRLRTWGFAGSNTWGWNTRCIFWKYTHNIYSDPTIHIETKQNEFSKVSKKSHQFLADYTWWAIPNELKSFKKLSKLLVVLYRLYNLSPKHTGAIDTNITFVLTWDLCQLAFKCRRDLTSHLSLDS